MLFDCETWPFRFNLLGNLGKTQWQLTVTFLGGEVNLAKSLRKLKNGQFVVAVSGSNSWIGVRKIAHKWWCHIRTYRITVWLGKCDALDAVHLYLGVYPGVDKWRWGIYVQDGEGIFIFSCVFSERYGLFMSSLHQDVKACCMLKSWWSALFKLKPSFWSLGYLHLRVETTNEPLPKPTAISRLFPGMNQPISLLWPPNIAAKQVQSASPLVQSTRN